MKAARLEMGTHERVWAAVRRIPRGRVATYGQIAELAGLPRQARLVGYALHALPHGTSVPWQRVVNAKGQVSPRSGSGHEGLQRAMLEAEGVVFDTRDVLDLKRFRYRPRITSTGARARGGAR